MSSSSGSFGIHLGNTSACIAIAKEGKYDVLANEAGNFVTPAVLTLQDDGHIVVGLAAKQQIPRNAQACVINSTMMINSDGVELQDFETVKKFSCSNVNRKENGTINYSLQRDDASKNLSPEVVATEILKNINSIATHALKKETSHTAVLAVPLHFTQVGRKNLSDIAEEAGFHVLQIISEPAAAALAYTIGQNPDITEHVLIYRIGGISADVTLLKSQNGMYEIIGTVRDASGSNKVTELLVEYIAKEFFQKYKLDPHESRRTMAKLYPHAEMSKHVLSSMGSAHIFIESLMDGVDFSHNLSRARFENLLFAQLDVLKKPVTDLLTQTNFAGKIDKIILSGGGMKIPKFQSTIQSMFPDAELLNQINPDEVIALGCARQAALVAKQWDPDCKYLDMEICCAPCDVLIKVDDNEVVRIKAGTIVPYEATFRVDSGKSKTKFDVMEQKGEDSTKIGEIIIDDLKPDVDVFLRFGLDGIEITKALD